MGDVENRISALRDTKGMIDGHGRDAWPLFLYMGAMTMCACACARSRWCSSGCHRERRKEKEKKRPRARKGLARHDAI